MTLKLHGDYVLFGKGQATEDAGRAFEELGLVRPSSGIGMAIGIGEVAETATVAMFVLHNVAAGDVVGTAQMIFDETRKWFARGGNPDAVLRSDVSVTFEQTPEYKRLNILIPGFDNTTTNQAVEIVEVAFEQARKGL